MYRFRIRVVYPLSATPLTRPHLVLRTCLDWDRDVHPVTAEDGGDSATFEIEGPDPFLDFKPCLVHGNRIVWSKGANKLAVAGRDDEPDVQEVYPYFFATDRGEVGPRESLASDHLGRELLVRIYRPPGYRENGLKRYPVLYMHDGQNLFFAEEAFLGREWRVDETLRVLDAMNAIDQTLVVGIHSGGGHREHDYSMHGWADYAPAVVEELKPWIDRRERTLPGRSRTGVVGSSLGGVISLYLAWRWPHVFGNVASLSGAFWYENDLAARVRRDPVGPRRHLQLYLDSGWPDDNYEVTLSMANALLDAGFRYGSSLLHFAFPYARHTEGAWAARAHLPIQFFTGRLARRAAALGQGGG